MHLIFRELISGRHGSHPHFQNIKESQAHVLDREGYKPLATAIHIIKSIQDMYPEDFEFHAEYFDKIMGTSHVRKALEIVDKAEDIIAQFVKDIEIFAKTREPYLLY